MNIYKSYFNEFIKLFPTIQDNIQLKEYKYLQKHYENNLTNEHIEKQKSLYNKYLNSSFKKDKKLSCNNKKIDFKDGFDDCPPK